MTYCKEGVGVDMMIRSFLLGFLALVLVSFGQTSLKFGLNHIGGFSLVMEHLSSSS